MHTFKHPKYYKELRKRNKSDQAISEEATDVFDTSVRPDPGLNLLADSSDPVHGQQPSLESGATSFRQQASSAKQQASSKPEPVQVQASSAKRQASQPE